MGIWNCKFNSIYYILNTKNTGISVILNIKSGTVTVINVQGQMINYINLGNIILIKIIRFITGGKKIIN